MKNKLLFIIMFVLFASFVSAQCPEGQVCPPDQQQAYTYDQFQNDFANDPLVAAQNHPQEYMRYIKENPQAVAENPQAYENAVRQDVKYINQNKDAFLSYAQTKGVTFTSIDGDFTSFDTGTGRIETKVPSGQKPTSFSFDEIRTLDLNGGNNFRVNNNGELTYDLENRGNVEKVKLRGKLETKVNVQESLSDTTIDVIVTDGKVSIGEPSRGILNLELTGGNTAKLLPACKNYGDKNCGFVEVNVKQDTPIPIWRGVLLKGKATIRDRGSIDLHGESRYQTPIGTKIEVSKLTRFTNFNIVSGTGRDFNLNDCLVEYSCIQEATSSYTKWRNPDVPETNLKVIAEDGNQIKIDAQDSAYRSVVVKEIDEVVPRVLVGEIDGVKGYVAKNGYIEFDDGQWRTGRERKLREHPNYESARNEVSKIPTEETKVDLNIKKQDGSTARIVFSRDRPISQGKLAGLKTDIGHVFKYGGRHPWMIYNGQPSANTKGEVSEELPTSIAKFATEKRGAELSLLFDSIDSLDSYETRDILEGSKTVDVDTLRLIVDKYDEVYKTAEEKQVQRMDFLHKSNIDSPAAQQLQREILDKIGTLKPELMGNILYATEGRESMQKEALSRVDEIRFPADALKRVESDELRKTIIQKTKTVNTGRSILGEPTASPMKDYLSELERIDPELQKLAMDNLDFRSGVFSNPYTKGEALRRTLAFHEKKPEQMKVLLDRMPTQSDMGFNPVGFSTIYFNDEFQEKTKGLDFANRYSIAYTAQRYLDQRGTWLPDDRSKAIDLIIQQRARFSNHVILDENTYYIPITHEERQFDNSRMVQLARDSGVKDVADQSMKGAGAKGKFLETVRTSKDKGKTTVHFSNHGGPNHQWLSQGQAGVETSDQMRRPEAISYVEFGDALAERGNLGEVTVMVDSCYSKDFTDNLYHYLHTVKGVRDMPTVITETNRGQLGFGNVFIEAVERSHEKGKPLTGADMYKVDSQTFFNQDLTVTMPVTSEEEAKYSKPETPGVIDMGSPYDEGAAEPPRKPKGEPSEYRPGELPTTVIEIAQNEQEMEELLAVG